MSNEVYRPPHFLCPMPCLLWPVRYFPVLCFCSSWGESFFITVQVILLLILMFYYNQQSAYLMLFFPILAGIVWYLTSDLVTTEILGYLQTSAIPMMLLSRVREGVCVLIILTIVITYLYSLILLTFWSSLMRL